ncbi:MAG: AAA family ATPase [Planctomycetota bacterium]|nr:AAA family ATPase [Planctomycetota bacterium]
MSQKMAYINYRKSDSFDAAQRLQLQLKSRLGVDAVYVDLGNSLPGEEWTYRHRDQLKSATVMLSLIGNGWLTASDEYHRRRIDSDEDWVRREISSALEWHIPVIPILVGPNPKLPPEAALPRELWGILKYQCSFLRADSWESDFESLFSILVDVYGFHEKWWPASANGRQAELRVPTRRTYVMGCEFQGIRCFGGAKQSISFGNGHGRPSRWTLILGDNGTGKTTLLQLLAMFDSGSDLGGTFRTPWSEKLPSRFFGSSSPNLSQSVTLQLSESPFRGGRGDLVEPYSITCVLDSGRPVHLDDGHGLILFGYGAARRIGATSLRVDNNPLGADATASLFDDQVSLINAEEWLLRLDYAAQRENDDASDASRQLNRVQDLLTKLLPDVKSIRFATSEFRVPGLPQVEFQTPYGWVPLRNLGYGYQSMISWVVDFAARMFFRHPNSADPLKEAAVVLIDEIDSHLHPRWQRKVMRYLTGIFPNTQFIATAHSPLVVQAADEETNIVVLRRRGKRVVVDSSQQAVRGWRVDQVLSSDLFDLPSLRPVEYDKWLRQRELLLTKPELSARDKQRLTQLEAKIGTLPAGSTLAGSAELMDLARRSLKLLEERNGRKK